MTEITRISTLSTHTNAVSNFSKVQVDLAKLQDQLSSGLKGRTFEDYNGQVEQLTALDKRVKQLQSFIENNSETESRLRTQENALSQIINITDQVKGLFVLRNNPAFKDDMAFDTQMLNMRESIAQELNINLEGRYLFGGTRTDTPPVIVDPAVPEAVTPGVPDNAYYQGGTENVNVRLDDGIDKEYSVRADDEAFQLLFTALSLGLKAHAEDDQALSEQAQDLLDEAKDGILTLRARVYSDTVDVERVISRQNDLRLYFTGVVQEIAKVDPVEAASRVAIEQATLTATFQVFARISSLRLSDFL